MGRLLFPQAHRKRSAAPPERRSSPERCAGRSRARSGPADWTSGRASARTERGSRPAPRAPSSRPGTTSTFQQTEIFGEIAVQVVVLLQPAGVRGAVHVAHVGALQLHRL